MILLCGISSESPIAKVNQRLIERGAHIVHFSQRQFAEAELDWKLTAGKSYGHLHLSNCSYRLEEFRAIYIRFMSETDIPEVKDADAKTKEHCHRLHQAFYQWLEVTQSLVVNKHSTMFSNSSKPYQALWIRRYGLETPPTLITNDPNEVIAFKKRHKRIIYKSISGVRSIVKEFDKEDKERLEQIRYCPVQFQARLKGFDVRVHVIGEKCITTKIVSTGTDYRYAHKDGGKTDLQPFTLPETIAESCIRLTQALGLHFSGIDLKFSTDGKVYCFEVNPMPGYSYYESNTGQPISDTLAEYLLQP